MKYKKYNGKDKYHFRVYKRYGHHPFVVVMVSETTIEGRIVLSGYLITHDIKKILDYPNNYKQLKTNPNKNDLKPAYICLTRLENIDITLFSKPYTNWHLSKEDEMLIDELEKNAKEKRD